MGCPSCGSRSRVPPSAQQRVTSTAPRLALSDDSFKLCVYTHPSRGQTHVYGAPLFRERIDGVHMIQDRQNRLWKIHYGWRAGGEKFLVHVEDIKTAPHLFREVDTGPRPPSIEKQPVEPPVRIVDEEVEDTRPPEPKRIDLKAVVDREQSVPVAQEYKPPSNGFDLQTFPGVTHKVAEELERRGVDSLDDILDLGEDGLKDIPYIGPVRAKMLYGAAMEAARA